MKITYILLSLLFWGFDYPISLFTFREVTGQINPSICVVLAVVDYLVELGSTLFLVRLGKEIGILIKRSTKKL
ncbi:MULTISPECIES: hypothetical protein [Metallosphaera]|uniref:Uncharacterized protein n=2 Tax=Metallosphaera TaxID=41980 RepID=A0A0K1SUK4_9CREN|nr:MULTISPECIES: hypothetical protein [Metallosphaera]AKV73911.1 hypothetical protein MsedA_0844 [Metallosphaera sedula]AKV76152.1 hypothetical protein MsedB_0845 [Metallosphaera sedula]AKV78404.1 hypothetical protein MsedC_0844 [Metallosphaera sedula]AKV80649.1 hypothetical protein MsedD_0845 [Metallosphaera sedula]AKV82892.1 hypothetical protein MsedE_0844 [Metallosphaera sedula]